MLAITDQRSRRRERRHYEPCATPWAIKAAYHAHACCRM